MTGRSSSLRGSYQSRWRIAGMIAIGAAALMAIGSISTGILRDTVIHAFRIFSPDPPGDLVPGTTLFVCAAYWAAFSVALITALFLAAIDIRYIRLQYALEKQQLFKQNLGDGLARGLLDEDRKN